MFESEAIVSKIFPMEYREKHVCKQKIFLNQNLLLANISIWTIKKNVFVNIFFTLVTLLSNIQTIVYTHISYSDPV